MEYTDKWMIFDMDVEASKLLTAATVRSKRTNSKAAQLKLKDHLMSYPSIYKPGSINAQAKAEEL